MFEYWIRASAFVITSFFWLGISAQTASTQQPASTKDTSPAVVQVGDFVVTIKDLEQYVKGYPEGLMASRESKKQLIESLITTKLYAMAARDAKMAATISAAEKEDGRRSVLAYAYAQRYVHPKYSEEEARKYFIANKEKYGSFAFTRTKIMSLLRREAVAEIYPALMKKWNVVKRDDLYKTLDLNNIQDPSLVLAQVGPEKVTAADVKELAGKLGKDEDDFSSPEEAKQYLLDGLILERLYALEATKIGLADDPVVKTLLDSYDDQILATKYVRQLESKITQDEARRYYQAHPDEFKRPDQLRVRQIVLATSEQAQAAKAKLNGGTSFEKVAKTMSIDSASAANGGSIGWIRKGYLQPEVEKVAFQLKTHVISEPIKTPGRYYILRVDDRLEGAMKPFQGVMPEIIRTLRFRAVEAERKRLAQVYKVTIKEELL